MPFGIFLLLFAGCIPLQRGFVSDVTSLISNTMFLPSNGRIHLCDRVSRRHNEEGSMILIITLCDGKVRKRSRVENKRSTRGKIFVWFGLGLAAGYWLLESFMDTLFGKGDFTGA